MARTTFSGPVGVGTAAASGTLVASRNIALPPTANASTDISFAVPAGRLLRATVLTETAFTGATVTAQIGTAQGGSEVASATNVKSTGAVALVLNQAGIADTLDKTIWVRLAQTTPTAVGAARLVLEYVPS
jgi:hypothetical protein